MSTPSESDCPLPRVILVTGAAGAGKTELVRHLLGNAEGFAVASLSDPTSAQPNVVGRRLGPSAHATAFDYLLVELTAADDPRSFMASDAARGSSGVTAGPCESVVTVVDAVRVLEDFCSHELMRDRVSTLPIGDFRSVADVLTEQIEAADTLVLNKTEWVAPAKLRGLKALLRCLNPGASLLECEFGRVPPQSLLGARPDLQRRAAVPGWKWALEGRHFPDAERLGITSLIYRERRPFHPQRLYEFLNTSWDGIVRGSGHFWIASRPDWVLEFSQAGAARRYRAAATWWASTLEDRACKPAEVEDFVEVEWDATYGDRHHELVLVGIGMNTHALRLRLNECLATDEELSGGRERWQTLQDPFPCWTPPSFARRTGALH